VNNTSKRRAFSTNMTVLSVAMLPLLGGCGSPANESGAKALETQASSTPSPYTSTLSPSQWAKIRKDSGIPDAPTGQELADILEALRRIDSEIGGDEEKAISAIRNQCSSINGGAGNLAGSAAERFSYRGNKISVTQGQQVVDLLKKSGVCKIT
jgi:hypothetical protein